MDKVTHYRTLVKQILTEYDNWAAGGQKDENGSYLVFDDEHLQYLWLFMGWQRGKRVKGITIHTRIKNDKIWIEEDWMEEGIANELLKVGVPHEDIVLAFHPPEDRKLTDFAIA